MLSYSVEANLLPTLEFLQRELGLSDESLHERIVRASIVLGCSLEKRLSRGAGHERRGRTKDTIEIMK